MVSNLGALQGVSRMFVAGQVVLLVTPFLDAMGMSGGIVQFSRTAMAVVAISVVLMGG